MQMVIDTKMNIVSRIVRFRVESTMQGGLMFVFIRDRNLHADVSFLICNEGYIMLMSCWVFYVQPSTNPCYVYVIMSIFFYLGDELNFTSQN